MDEYAIPIPHDENGELKLGALSRYHLVTSIETLMGTVSSDASGPSGSVTAGEVLITLVLHTTAGPTDPFVLKTGSDDLDLIDALWNTLRDYSAKARSYRGYDANATVLCPGCGRRLFGDVKARGACLECFPVLPSGELPIDAQDSDA